MESKNEFLLLVVDDDDFVCKFLVDHLKSLGHAVIAARNGELAVEAVRDNPVDLILLDIDMPIMNGFQVIENLKADSRVRDIPIIMISGNDETDRAIKCIKLGTEDYLTKPFDLTMIGARIGASLEKKVLLDQLKSEKRRSEDLLRSILPNFVIEELKTTTRVKPRRF